MQIDKKYYKNYTIHRTILQNADDPDNSVVSCGFLYKQGNACEQKDICFNYYGGLYVISGTGVYIDAETGVEYPVKPGCVLQRMPGKRHHTIIDRSSNWLEFYFCGAAKVFSTLVDMKLVSNTPVFYVGKGQEIFERLLAYMQLFEQTDDRQAAMLLVEFQQLLCYLNGITVISAKREWTNIVCESLHKNYKVGVPLQKIASECGIGYESLRKQFRTIFGCSLEQYRIQLRINMAKSMLLDREMPVKEIAAELGYCDVYAFSKQFKQQVGVSPGKFVSDWQKR